MSAPLSAIAPAPAQAAGQLPLGALLRDRGFALYLVARTTSAAGGALSSIALPFAVLSITGSAGSLGLVLLASRLPGIALGLVGGVIADRWSRRRIAICADVMGTVLQVCTGVLLLSGLATVQILTIVQLLAGAASSIFGPAAGALAAEIAPGGQIRRAGSVLSTATGIAQSGALALSGLLIAATGPGVSFVIDGLTFAISSLTLALIRERSVARPQPRPQPLLRAIQGGWSVVKRRPWLIVYAGHQTLINVLAVGPFFVLGPLIATQHLGGAPAWSAIAFGYVAGNILAAGLTYRLAPRRPLFAAILGSTALAPLLALLGVGAQLWLIVPAAVLAGLQATVYNTFANSTLQANLPDGALGRATAITGIGSTLLVPVGMGVAGLLAAEVGAGTVLIAGGALVIVAAVIAVAQPASRALLPLDRAEQAGG